MIQDIQFQARHLGVALGLTQAGLSVLVGLVLFGFLRAYRRPFLGLWALSFCCAALAGLGTSVAAVRPPEGQVGSFLLEAFVHAAALAQVAYVVAGAHALSRPWTPPRALTPRLALLSLAAGGLCVLGLRALSVQHRGLFDALSVRAFSGLGFLAAAAFVARGLNRRPTLARGLVAGFFAAAGALKLVDLALELARPEGGFLDSLAVAVLPRFLDLFVQLGLLGSLLLWFFEVEREAAARANLALVESERRRQLAEHMEAVGRLAGGVAHDFNNLLTAILGHAELLLTRLPEGHPDREDLAPIHRSARRAAELVRELLTFSRRQPRRPRLFSLDGLLADMHRTLSRLMGEGIAFELDLGAADGVLFADPAQIELAVINLASNSRDALTGSGWLHFRTRREVVVGGEEHGLAPGRYLVLEVSDNGCGIPPEALGKIFEPFFTTKPGKGTGLGLASVYGIVKQSGGEIQVESQLGRGSTFRLWLPEVGEPVAESAGFPRGSDELKPLPPQRGGKESILLVEDDEAVRLLAHRQLTRAGYRVVMAESVEQAFECLAARAAPFELVLSDVVMPGRPARELLYALRARQPETRILFTSGYSPASIHQHGIELDAQCFLAKPFTAASLLEAVRGAIDGEPPAALVASEGRGFGSLSP